MASDHFTQDDGCCNAENKARLVCDEHQLGAGLGLAVVSWFGCAGYGSSLKNGHRPGQDRTAKGCLAET